MPTYRYHVPRELRTCQCEIERFCSIEEMLVFERSAPRCGHGNLLERIFSMRRSPQFHAGVYEHLGPEPIYCSTMQELKTAARENGSYSLYAEDMGGMFRAKEGRWV